ncbi:Predicted transcriptional regulator, BolA superfamily [gamma proteobacterium HdN1]|nr:Predicted transcriptional regulator, BolA superfamily [gamma proteobacterium HdN1]
MDENLIKSRLQTGFPDAEVHVDLMGNKAQVVVVSDAFAGKRVVQKQQMVYQQLNDLLASGELHAVSMQTLTPDEWAQKKKFGFL